MKWTHGLPPDTRSSVESALHAAMQLQVQRTLAAIENSGEDGFRAVNLYNLAAALEAHES